MLVDYLQKLNVKNKFVNETVLKIGYPRWDKAIKSKKTNAQTSSRNANGNNDVYYIPFVRDSQNFVNAAMLVAFSNTDTSVSYACDWQYNNFTGSSNDSATRFASFFMMFDNMVFGHKKFNILDTTLFKSGHNVAEYVEINKPVVTNDLFEQVTYCQDYIIYFNFCTTTWADRCKPKCDQCYECTSNFQITYCWNEIIEVSSGGAGENPGGGSGPGGPTPPDCGSPIGRGIAARGNLPCSGGGGWTPIIEPEPDPPYVCNYQLTQHEKDVFDQLDNENDEADQDHLNLDCQGTKRTGNVFFKGTKEHWLIQLDYVSKNPLYGDVEFAIPNSSPNGNRGYADIVNLQNKSIFEIKPDNPVGITSGQTEVANYVSKANQHCLSTIPIGVPWVQGGNYAPTILPTGTPNRYLTTRLHTPGVVVYTYQNISNPNPAPPIAVPTSVVQKFKHLIDRLRQNFDKADEIIAEYLQQNPDLVTYVKGAAIGAGVAIVVGTIIEDFLTAGAGIADDWACFVLSYRIIRFAIAL